MSESVGRMEQRLSCICIGVSDIPRARRFYEDMGWMASPASRTVLPLFNANGFVFMISDRRGAANEAFGGTIPEEVAASLESPSPFNGVLFSYVVRADEEVENILDRAVLYGGRLLSAPQLLPWGNRAGFFADPDGHIWEVSRTSTPLQPDGTFRIPDEPKRVEI